MSLASSDRKKKKNAHSAKVRPLPWNYLKLERSWWVSSLESLKKIITLKQRVKQVKHVVRVNPVFQWKASYSWNQRFMMLITTCGVLKAVHTPNLLFVFGFVSWVSHRYPLPKISNLLQSISYKLPNMGPVKLSSHVIIYTGSTPIMKKNNHFQISFHLQAWWENVIFDFYLDGWLDKYVH